MKSKTSRQYHILSNLITTSSYLQCEMFDRILLIIYSRVDVLFNIFGIEIMKVIEMIK